MSKANSSEPHGLKAAVVIGTTENAAEEKWQRQRILYEAGGRPLVLSVMAAASRVAAAEDIFIATECDAESVESAVAGTGARVVSSKDFLDQGGTALAAHADLIVLAGDLPLLRPETIEALLERHRAEGAAMTILTARDDGKLDGCDSSIYAVRMIALQGSEEKLCPSTLAEALRKSGERVVTLQAADPAELQSVRTMADLAVVDAVLRAAAVRRLMESGVAIYRPETCVMDADVEVGAGTVIEPFVQLLGKTRIGTDCRIRSYSVIEDCSVGDQVMVRQSCVLTGSAIASHADIGPFARVRPGSEIGEEVHIGNFVEVKKSKLGRGVKAGHLAYLGDAEIGAKTNIGAGVITCNYDGVHKHTTRIGNGVFVGSDSTLVAPVSIEDGAYIGAGSCITKDVPTDALAVGRAHQVTKEGWAAARRAKHKAKE